MPTTYETATTRLTQQELGACALIQDLLPLYIEGEVSPGSRDLIVEHLARCERCSGFLAGAQTALVQLRRDAAAQTTAIQQSRPEQQKLASGQGLIRLMATFAVCAIGGLGAFALSMGLRYGHPGSILVGMVLGLGGFGGLIGLAQASARMSWVRWFALTLCCITGIIPAMLVIMLRGPAAVLLPAIVLALLSFTGIWALIRGR